MLSIKFGGTSMGSEKSLKCVIAIIKKHAGQKLAVTVSAMSGVTNLLLELANKAVHKGIVEHKILEEIENKHNAVIQALIQSADLRQRTFTYIQKELKKLKYFLEAIAVTGELSIKSNDVIMALGEKFAACMLANMLKSQGIPAQYVNLENLIKKSYPEPNRIFFKDAEKYLANELKKVIQLKQIPICTGFFGRVPGGILDGVGRGYSDFTCALAGAGLKAKEIHIWTDVDGMFSADPRIVKDSYQVEKLSFQEASELAHFGAKILHPQTIHPAVEADIPVRILNTFNPDNPGTLILPQPVKSKHLFKSVAVKKHNTIVRICSSRMLMQYGFMAKIFDIFRKYKLSIDLVATSEVNVSISFQCGQEILKEALAELKELGKVYVYLDNAIISVIGQEMEHNKHLISKIFDAIEKAKIEIKLISQGASKINLSFVVADQDADQALKVVHGIINS